MLSTKWQPKIISVALKCLCNSKQPREGWPPNVIAVSVTVTVYPNLEHTHATPFTCHLSSFFRSFTFHLPSPPAARFLLFDFSVSYNLYRNALVSLEMPPLRQLCNLFFRQVQPSMARAKCNQMRMQISQKF